eukprot:948014-Pyramimonas_sp.AAC.1
MARLALGDGLECDPLADLGPRPPTTSDKVQQFVDVDGVEPHLKSVLRMGPNLLVRHREPICQPAIQQQLADLVGGRLHLRAI